MNWFFCLPAEKEESVSMISENLWHTCRLNQSEVLLRAIFFCVLSKLITNRCMTPLPQKSGSCRTMTLQRAKAPSSASGSLPSMGGSTSGLTHYFQGSRRGPLAPGASTRHPFRKYAACVREGFGRQLKQPLRKGAFSRPPLLLRAMHGTLICHDLTPNPGIQF
jgi:hypothetical protein